MAGQQPGHDVFERAIRGAHVRVTVARAGVLGSPAIGRKLVSSSSIVRALTAATDESGRQLVAWLAANLRR